MITCLCVIYEPDHCFVVIATRFTFLGQKEERKEDLFLSFHSCSLTED